MLRHRRAILVAVLAASLAGRAAAAVSPIEELERPEPAAPSPHGASREHPWSRGVPEAERHAAETLFYEGNKLMRESITITAAARYREALTHWDHPNIHFNLAIALMTLDQPVETYENLKEATRYGPEPLEQERFEHARNYLTLLEKQLARVRIRCAVSQASVELDGKPLFTGPGQYEGLVRAGRHTLVARREGYVANQSNRVLDGGQTAEIDLELKTVAELTETTHRWPAWRPWAVVATGAVAAAAGGWMYTAGRNKIRTYDSQAASECPAPGFCPTEPSGLAKLRSDGRTFQNVGVAALAGGGATLAAGVALVIMNHGQTRVRTYGAGEPAAPAPRAPAPEPHVQVFPFIGPDASGVSVLARF